MELSTVYAQASENKGSFRGGYAVREQCKVHEIGPNLKILIRRPRPVLPLCVQEEVEKHWLAARNLHPRLFNGNVFSADCIAPSTITGHWTEFRTMLAQIQKPMQFGKLAQRPLSVSGVLVCAAAGGNSREAAVILGRRSAQSVFQAAKWQLPPGGSLDDSAMCADDEIDWRRQLLLELQEELGVPADAVRSMRPICMVEYPTTRSLEIGIAISCRWNSGEIVRAHQAFGNSEYEELRVVEIGCLIEMVQQLGNDLSPPASIFSQRLNMTSQQ